MKATMMRFLAMLLCVIMVMAMPIAALAEDGTDPGTDPGETDTLDDPEVIPPEEISDAPEGGALSDENTDSGGDNQPDAPESGSRSGTPESEPSDEPVDLSMYAEDVTTKLKVKVSEGKATALADRKAGTSWTTKKDNASITLTIPSSKSVDAMYIQWEKVPTEFRFFEFDGDGGTLAARDQTDFTSSFEMYFPINELTRQIVLEFPKRGESIMELYIYSGGEVPPSVHVWEYPGEETEKVDMLFIMAHMGDELLYMGGAIPYYDAVRGKRIQVAFLANEDRRRKHEALSALWDAGLRMYPSFGNFSDKRVRTLDDALKNWNEGNMLSGIVGQIRKYQPDVIVTNALAGEGGHGTRMATAKVVTQAVTEAADETKYTDSAEKYGTWQTQKLYLHLGDEDAQITMDWQTAYDELNGKTPLRVATDAFADYDSISTKMTGTGDEDATKFSLVFSDVGDDIDKNDFFENVGESSAPAGADLNEMDPIDPAVLNDDLGVFEPPTVTPSPSPTPTPLPSPTPEPQGFGVRDNLEPLKIFGIALAIAVGATAVGLGVKVFLSNRNAAVKKKKKSSSSRSGRKSTGTRTSSGTKKTPSTKKKRPPEDDTY